uniref:B30.2/SPRY domain-containing protein n=1 Tax=Leptobrachium leishanense TaxID=445787 RepID=A0A8C5QNA6_9ANUR
MERTRDQPITTRPGSLKPPLPGGYVEEKWVWDGDGVTPGTELSPCGRDVYFHTDPVLESCGTAGVRGTTVERYLRSMMTTFWVHDDSDRSCGSWTSLHTHCWIQELRRTLGRETCATRNVNLTPLDHREGIVYRGFAQGEHYWEVEFVEPPSGFSVMVGVGTGKARLHAGSFDYINLLGQDAESWGLSYKGTVCHRGGSRQYTEPFYNRGTVIGIHLNLERGTLAFYKNGQSLGLAFSGLHKVQSPLYPMVSSTAPATELTLGCRCSSLPTLEERCLRTLAHGLAQRDVQDLLPLPVAVRWKLKSWKKDQNLEALDPEL